MQLLKIDNLSIQLDHKSILSDISLSIDEGEMVSLIGPNGAGKSTLLNSIMGLTHINFGQIQYFNKYTKLNKIVKQKIAYVFQLSVLDKDQTVYENLFLSGLLFGHKKSKIKSLISQYLISLNLNTLKDKKTAELSGGERRLIDLARVFINEPKLIVLDEPFNELDIHYREQMFAMLKNQASEKGCGIFLTTHLIDECNNVDRMIVLNGGAICLNVNPKKLIETKTEYMLELNATNEKINAFEERYGSCWYHNDKVHFWVTDPTQVLDLLKENKQNQVEDLSLRKTRLSDVYLWHLSRG